MRTSTDLHRWISGLCLVFTLLLTTFSTADAQTRELVLRFKDGTPQQVIDNMLNEFNATELDIAPITRIRLWRLDSMIYVNNEYLFIIEGYPPLTIQESGQEAQNKTSVFSAGVNEKTKTHEPLSICDEVCLDMQRFPPAENCYIKVAIIDTGVDADHTYLEGSFWTNEIEGPEPNGIDDDENGLIDDIIGYDFHNKLPEPIDSHSHGTHVLGTVEQIKRAAGAHHAIKIMALKSQDRNGNGSVYSAIRAMDYAMEKEVQIINLSLGYEAPPPPSGAPNKPAPMEYAIELAGSRNNILVVCAAGNKAKDIDEQGDLRYYPSNFDSENLISVAATECDDVLTSYSNFGVISVDLGTTGRVFSTVLNNRWAIKNGTSMATPIVSATAAILGTHTLIDPCNFHYSQIKSAILTTVRKVGLPLTTKGVLEPVAALPRYLHLLAEGPPSQADAEPEEVLTTPIKEELPEEGSKLLIYPNPASDRIFLEWEESSEKMMDLKIYDSAGQVVSSRKILSSRGRNHLEWELENINSAFLFLVIQQDGKFICRKIIKP